MEILKRIDGQLEMDLPAVFRLLLRKAWLIVIIALLGAVISVGYTYRFVPPSYEASVSLYISNTVEGTESVSVTTGDLAASMVLVETCGTIIKDEDTLELAAQLSGLDYTPEQLQEMLQVIVVENTKILYVIATAENPQEAALIADSIAEITPGLMKTIEPASSVRIMNQAKVPDKKSAPSYSKAALTGFIAGALIAVILLIAAAILNTGVKSAGQLEALGLSVLAVLPELPEKVKDNLVYSLPGKKSRSILFTEFPPASDRPFPAAEIAGAMAEDGYKVLLLDCDLRNPRLSKDLDLKKGPGVSDILVGRLRGEAAVQKYIQNVDVITAGNPSLNPDSLLASEEMGEMLDVLDPEYDYILLFSSVEKEDQGAVSLAGRVSGTVVVTRKKATRTDALRDHLIRLESSGAHVLGTIFDSGKS